MIVVIMVCAIVLLIVFMKRKLESIMNLLIRTLSGSIMIYVLNQVFQSMGLEIFVGINLISLLTCTILGFPGVLLLYGVMYI